MKATLFNDPSCPWGYSANPPLRAIEWRYGDQIEWELVMIGLSESPDELDRKGFTPARLAQFHVDIRDRYGMPFAIEPKPRNAASAPACKAIISAGQLHPGSEWRALKALQLLNFTTPLLLDDPEQLAEALSTVPGIDPEAVVAGIGSEPVEAAYAEGYARSREAAHLPGHHQGKTADHGEGQRYTAPSVIFSDGERSIEAAGFQTLEAYGVAIANLDPSLERRPAPRGALEALLAFPDGLTTQEVTAVMTDGLEPPDRVATEKELVGLVAEGAAKRVQMGDDALWIAAS